jgi:hypothetical protein
LERPKHFEAPPTAFDEEISFDDFYKVKIRKRSVNQQPKNEDKVFFF